MKQISRNAPCHCGSGKRFKHCHGAVTQADERATPGIGGMTSTADALNAQAVQAAQNGVLDEAIRLFEQALAIDRGSEEINLNLGTALFQAGRAEESLACIGKVLSGNSRNVQAMHLQACALAQLGRHDEALLEFDRLISIAGEDTALLTNRGNCLTMVGRFEAALASFDQALVLDPLNSGALVGRSDAMHKLGKYTAALEFAERALAINPDLAEALNNRGNALLALKQYAEALKSYDRALVLKPNYAEAHHNRGSALWAQGNLSDAVASFDLALLYKAGYAAAHNSRGGVLMELGRRDEAIASFRAALLIDPEHYEAHSNLGGALKEQGNLQEAVTSCRRALAINPKYAIAHYNLGGALQAQGKLSEASASYSNALALKPDYLEALVNKGVSLLGEGRHLDAIEDFQQALKLKPDSCEVYSNLLYLHAFTRDISLPAERDLASRWECVALTEAARAAARNRRASFFKTRLKRSAGRKLRLGVVSAEIGQHAVAEFLEPFLAHVDRSRFRVTLYPTVADTGPRAARIGTLADEVQSLVGISDDDAANRIRSAEIDVLIDTTAHMAGCRLGIFAHRAAPVQCHYIGYHGTTGLTEMDWFIADDVLLPASCDAHFREKIWRLPRLWISYRGDRSLPESAWAPAADGIVTLGSFNNLGKVRRESLRLWGRIMNRLPQSRLLLKDRKAADAAIQKRIRTELADHGVSGDRVEFISWAPDWKSHMALYDRLDIALDTIPLNSGTTAFDALWMGAPLIGMEGDWMGGRLTAAILRALEKPEWIAKSEDEYVAIVAALAQDVEQRKVLRASQRALMENSPLCNAAELTNALEAAFESMFDRACANGQASV